MEIESVLQRHGIFCIQDFERRVEDGDERLEEDLYAYYANSGQMPYGTMKARSGDPGEFIFDKTIDYLSTRKPLG